MKKFIEAWKDPKKKSIMMLSAYGVFFIIVFAIIFIGGQKEDTTTYKDYQEDTPKEEKKETFDLEYLNNLKSYDYIVKYTKDNSAISINGTYVEPKAIFTYNNQNYYFDGTNLYLSKDKNNVVTLQYKIEKLLNKQLYGIIKEGTEETKTTYKNGNVEYNYSIDSKILYKYIFDSETMAEAVSNIKLTFHNKQVDIVIDLSNLGAIYDKIEVNYSNLDNILSLSIEGE